MKTEEIDQLSLEWVTLAVNAVLSREEITLHHTQCSEWKRIPDDVGRMVCQFVGELPKEPLKVFRFAVPSTWLDHLRADHFPRLWVKRFPIKWRDLRIEVGAVHTNLKRAFPMDKPYIRFVYDVREEVPKGA